MGGSEAAAFDSSPTATFLLRWPQDLAKRLLLGKSSSSDLEKAMVARLKTECGWQFTAKLEGAPHIPPLSPLDLVHALAFAFTAGMFKDIDLSAELQRQFDAFRSTAGEGSGAAVGLEVAILTSSYWPTYPKTTMALPAALAPSLASFERFYSSKFTSNRRLQWQHNLCHCLLKANFPAVRKPACDHVRRTRAPHLRIPLLSHS